MTATTVVDQVHLADHVCWTHDDESVALDVVGEPTGAAVVAGQLRIVAAVGAYPTAPQRLLHLLGDVPAPERPA